MPIDDTDPRPALPRRLPAGDPRLAAVATRLRSLRVELDRLDDQVDLLDRPQRVEIARHTVKIRAEVDSLENELCKRGAGL